MALDFLRKPFTASYLSPAGGEVIQRQAEVRFDPLLGTSCRIAEGVKLQTTDAAKLECFQQPDANCPFCPERIGRVTPKILPEICAEGRVRVGDTLLFPNLVPYSQYAAVAVFSPRHWLDLKDFTPPLLADNLNAALRYLRAVYRADPKCEHCAYNINYLYPSGGSLPHPHAQIFLDPHPTSMMRLQHRASERYLVEQGHCYWEDLVEAEQRAGARYLGSRGRTVWLTPFAPLGFNEVRAIVTGRENLLDFDDSDVAELAAGISRVLFWYASIGYNSFNLVLYSGPLSGGRSYRVNLAMVTRTAMVPFYRSDSMYMERLHWEAVVDRAPERVAAELRATL